MTLLYNKKTPNNRGLFYLYVELNYLRLFNLFINFDLRLDALLS